MSFPDADMAGPAADRVIHITDLHFWAVSLNPALLLGKRALGMANLVLRRRRHFRTELAERFARDLAATGVKTVIAGGDLSTTSLDGEFLAAAAFLDRLKELGMRVYAIPGNHDVYTFSSARRRLFERRLGAHMPGADLPARVLLPGGTPVVFVPTSGPNVLTSRGRILAGEIDRAAALVADAPAGPVLVAGHYPLLPRTAAYAQGWSHRLARADALRRALGGTGRTLLYAAGHVHRFSLTRDPDWRAMTHLTSAPLFYHGRGQSGAYSTLAARPDGFQVWKHLFDGEWKSGRLNPFPG